MIFQTALGLAAIYLRLSPLKKGRWRLINYFLPRLRANGGALGERIVRTRYDFLYKADLGDWLGQYVYLTGCYEPPTARIIAARLKPGNTFIDVGANSGFFTLLASRCVGAQGKVWAFEPVPSMRNRLQMNISLNGVNNIVVHDIALSNSTGECLFHEGPPGHKGLSSLRSLNNEGATFAVKTRPLDELVDEDFTVNMIKIDVEGAEQLVINGMQRLLTQQRPDVIIEITDSYLAAFGHDAVTLCETLCTMGYGMYRIEDEELAPMHPAEANSITQYNALFTFDKLVAPLC